MNYLFVSFIYSFLLLGYLFLIGSQAIFLYKDINCLIIIHVPSILEVPVCDNYLLNHNACSQFLFHSLICQFIFEELNNIMRKMMNLEIKRSRYVTWHVHKLTFSVSHSRSLYQCSCVQEEDIVPSSRISEFYSFYYSAAVFAMASFFGQGQADSHPEYFVLKFILVILIPQQIC